MIINDPSLNRIIGKYQLSHIWDEVFLNIPGLKVNIDPIIPSLGHICANCLINKVDSGTGVPT